MVENRAEFVFYLKRYFEISIVTLCMRKNTIT